MDDPRISGTLLQAFTLYNHPVRRPRMQRGRRFINARLVLTGCHNSRDSRRYNYNISPHSTLYIQEHQRSNLSDAGPDEALRFLVLRRRFVPFNDHFDEGGLQWSKTLDPSFFGDEIHYGDRISLWLDNKAHGMNVGRRETSIEVDATWVQLPPSKFDESI
jgi:hypothetical protein